jgi:hypothetical protein
MMEKEACATAPPTFRDDTIAQRMDQALQKQHAKQASRDYLGASSLGEPCARKLQYQYLAITPDQATMFSGATLRIFARGHTMEAMMLDWLRSAGFMVQTASSDQQSLGFSVADGRIQGHADGVIVGDTLVESNDHYPRLWENKALGNRSWKTLANKGVAIAKPIYASQIALYQAYLGLDKNPALFTAINADTMAIYSEYVPFNAELAQKMSDRAVMILRACEAQEWLPPISRDPCYYHCKCCAWQKICHAS